MPSPTLVGLLVKMRTTAGMAVAPSGVVSISTPRGSVDLQPLFKVGTKTSKGPGLVASESGWFRIAASDAPSLGFGVANPWDDAHSTLVRGVGLAGGSIELVEPDLAQQWVDPGARIPGLAAATEPCSFHDQDVELPPFGTGSFAWHLGSDFSQLREAREKAKGGAGVRIAHLDTGYDPGHKTLPQIDLVRQRNFIDKSFPNDARDRGNDGLLKNPGHGTGTLSILAGARFQWKDGRYDFSEPVGGAPDASIVPIRVGNSVVQITTSSVAEGIAYAADLCKARASLRPGQ